MAERGSHILKASRAERLPREERNTGTAERHCHSVQGTTHNGKAQTGTHYTRIFFDDQERIETLGMITNSYADDNSDEDMMTIMMMREVFIDMMMIKIYFPVGRFWFILAKIPDKLFMKLTLC